MVTKVIVLVPIEALTESWLHSGGYGWTLALVFRSFMHAAHCI